MTTYAVCSRCDFLRVLGEHAYGLHLPDKCPKCDAELVLRDDSARFEPTHVGRVARAIQQTRL